jgi:hypothetical protein
MTRPKGKANWSIDMRIAELIANSRTDEFTISELDTAWRNKFGCNVPVRQRTRQAILRLGHRKVGSVSYQTRAGHTEEVLYRRNGGA